jgi:hypothetical protein
LVRHAELGGNDTLAAHGCVLAGDNSLRVFANAQAIDFALRGSRHLAHTASGPNCASLRIALLRIQVLASSGSRLRRWPLKLTRFGGAPHSFAGGFPHGQNPPAVFP